MLRYNGTMSSQIKPRWAGIDVPLSSPDELDPAGQEILQASLIMLSSSTYNVLRSVFLHPDGITNKKLLKLHGDEISRTHIATILTRLLERGLVVRVARGVHRRSDSTYRLPGLTLELEHLLHG